jgi:hypothetical protein
VLKVDGLQLVPAEPSGDHAGGHQEEVEVHLALARGAVYTRGTFQGRNHFFLYIFMGFCVYVRVPLSPLRGQHTVLCHPRWLPTSGLTEFAVCWGGPGFEPRTTERTWIRTQDHWEDLDSNPGPLGFEPRTTGIRTQDHRNHINIRDNFTLIPTVRGEVLVWENVYAGIWSTVGT